MPCVHALGDPQDPLSQLDSDEDMDPGDDILAMQLPQGFRLHDSHPTVLDRTLIKRYVTSSTIGGGGGDVTYLSPFGEGTAPK